MGPELDLSLLTRLWLASLLGGLIGLEREVHGRPAGFRTHLLVSLGSCLFVITSIEFYRIYGNFSGGVPVGVDPGRVAAQVVTGIGFLGAGAIIRERATVRGLTTAACLWVAAALGVTCGIGLFNLAICVTLIALVCLLLLKQLEALLYKESYCQVKVWCTESEHLVGKIESALSGCGVKPLSIKLDKRLQEGQIYLEFQVKLTRRVGATQIAEAISLLEDIKRVRVE